MVSPYPAIDTARTTERLSAFLSEYIEEKPVDQYFEDYPTIGFFYKKKGMHDGGAQWVFPIGTGESPNNAWAGEYDLIGTAGTDEVRTVVYDAKNIFDALVISWVEQREIAGSDHRTFDRIAYKRDMIMNTTMKNLNEAYYEATQGASKIQSMAVGVDSTGSCGSLSQGTESTWASQELDHSDTYTNGGYEAMLQQHQNIRLVNGKTSAIFVPFDIGRDIESEFNVDVRYTDSPDTLKRGAAKLLFKNIPILEDNDCTANTMYWIDDRGAKFYCDTEGDMSFDPMMDMPYQKAYMAKFTFRGQFIITDRRAQGKIINVT